MLSFFEWFSSNNAIADTLCVLLNDRLYCNDNWLSV